MPFTDVASSGDVRENASFPARVDKIRLLLTRVDGRAYAIENRCPHLNLSMTRGRVEGPVIRCPWHGSTFNMCTGENIDWITSVAGMPVADWSRNLIAFGRKSSSVRTFVVREEEGRILVDL